MRRVWFTRGVILPLVVMLAASFVFLSSGSHNVEASAFAPTLTARTCAPGTGDVGGPACTPLNSPGAPATISETADWGGGPVTNGRSFPAQSVYFTPSGWGIPSCAGFSLSSPGLCPYGFDEKTGTFTSTTTFGLLNSQCAIAIPVSFPNGMRNASTDPSDSITAGAGFANLIADVNPADGIADGIEHWNDLLNNLIGAGLLPPTPPRERQILATVALGTQVWVDVLTYDAGLIGGAASAPLGSATTFILENANPTVTASPSLITDTCGLLNSFSQSAMASGGAVHRSNPASPGTKLVGLNSTSSRDADQGPSAPAEPTTFPLPGLDGDGLVNNLDTCPFTPNFGSVLSPAGVPFNGDEEVSPEFTDGIDSACDPNPTLFDGTDADGDVYQNRQDNCPLIPNGLAGPNPTNQADVGEFFAGTPVDGGPSSDSIGDACDLNPTVADGHFHTKLNLVPICITGGPFSDGDGDGWCDIEEVAIGGSTAGTPEALAVPNSCSDGADNDLDGNADLNDSAGGSAAPTGCQLPSHDLSIKKLNGPAIVSCAGLTQSYNVLTNNPLSSSESGEISIYLDSQPSYVPAPGPSPAPGKTAGSVASIVGATITASGPINIDGDADVEWLTKATVSLKKSPATTTVQVNVNIPAAPCVAGTTDLMITADLCHANDIAPLGVGPLNGACAGSATSDGGQDRNNANDVASISIDAQ